MLDLHYEHPALAVLYDLDSGWSIDRDFYLGLASGGQKRILDLGCGTGLLCDAYASLGHQVTGVDPARAMLDVARTKPYGSNVEWIESTAQSFRSEKRFDLIIMTGNAFQVFLEDQDILAVFETMRIHLAPGGVIAFETRNPAVTGRRGGTKTLPIHLANKRSINLARSQKKKVTVFRLKRGSGFSTKNWCRSASCVSRPGLRSRICYLSAV